MSPTNVVELRVQRRNRDRYMQRLELPGERRMRFAIVGLCIAGVVAAFVIGWCLS